MILMKTTMAVLNLKEKENKKISDKDNKKYITKREKKYFDSNMDISED